MDSSRTSLLDDDYDNYPTHTRLPNEEVLELYAELTLQGEYHLLPYEEAWKARRPFLESKGYELRPRYSEDWWPSWIGTDINPFFCEDSIDSCVRINFNFHFFIFPKFPKIPRNPFLPSFAKAKKKKKTPPPSFARFRTLFPDRRRGRGPPQAEAQNAIRIQYDIPLGVLLLIGVL
jgi:hypothetical protein